MRVFSVTASLLLINQPGTRHGLYRLRSRKQLVRVGLKDRCLGHVFIRYIANEQQTGKGGDDQKETSSHDHVERCNSAVFTKDGADDSSKSRRGDDFRNND